MRHVKRSRDLFLWLVIPVSDSGQRGVVRTENASKPHGCGVLNPVTFSPFPKNPVISAFFREIRRADEL